LKKPMEIKSKMLAIRKLGVFGLALSTGVGGVGESVEMGVELVRSKPLFMDEVLLIQVRNTRSTRWWLGSRSQPY